MITSIVKDLQQVDFEIKAELGLKSASDVEKNLEAYTDAVKFTVLEPVSKEVIDCLEDENLHSLVQALVTLKLVVRS